MRRPVEDLERRQVHAAIEKDGCRVKFNPGRILVVRRQQKLGPRPVYEIPALDAPHRVLPVHAAVWPVDPHLPVYGEHLPHRVVEGIQGVGHGKRNGPRPLGVVGERHGVPVITVGRS